MFKTVNQKVLLFFAHFSKIKESVIFESRKSQ